MLDWSKFHILLHKSLLRKDINKFWILSHSGCTISNVKTMIFNCFNIEVSGVRMWSMVTLMNLSRKNGVKLQLLKIYKNNFVEFLSMDIGNYEVYMG